MHEIVVPAPSGSARATARSMLNALAKPIGSLGRLEELATWLAGVHGRVPPRRLDDVRVVVFAGDHGITQSGISAYPSSVTSALVSASVGGTSGIAVLANQIGAHLHVFDIAVDGELDALPGHVSRYKIRRGSGSIDVEDALLDGEARAAFRAGRAIADRQIDNGSDLLIPGNIGIGNTTVAAALVAAALGLHPCEVVGTGAGTDEHGRLRRVAVVENALERAADRIHDPFDLLTSLGSACAAATAGFLVQSAARATPVLLDGAFSTAAALIAARLKVVP